MNSAVDALKRVGAVDPVLVDYRGSFALVGHADAANKRPAWIMQQVRNKAQGPSEVSSRIPLSLSRRKEIRCTSIIEEKRVLTLGRTSKFMPRPSYKSGVDGTSLSPRVFALLGHCDIILQLFLFCIEIPQINLKGNVNFVGFDIK